MKYGSTDVRLWVYRRAALANKSCLRGSGSPHVAVVNCSGAIFWDFCASRIILSYPTDKVQEFS